MRYVPLLKGRVGELDALVHTKQATAAKLRPLLDIPRLDSKTIESTKYLATSTTPRITYIDRAVKKIAQAWAPRPMIVDGYLWPADSMVETGEHIISYSIRRLEAEGVPVSPIVGYDRWEDPVYRIGLKSLFLSKRSDYCLRLDSHAISDSLEPDEFQHTIENILHEFEMSPECCSVIIDFGDLTSISINDAIAGGSRIVSQLSAYGFRRFITAGCSIPKTINLAVKAPDTVGLLIRREALIWKALRQEFPRIKIVYGDYGVRGPSSNDSNPSKYTNGKIRYTTSQQAFVSRGHPFRSDGGKYTQMHGLAATIVASPHYVGPTFSWGDEQILLCSQKKVLGSTTNWIAIDTNHHIAFVMQEVEEFDLVMAEA